VLLVPSRRALIGGADARIIMGEDESALLCLWREKRGEVELEDLSGNLIVRLGVMTAPLNRRWYERKPGRHALRTDIPRRTSDYLWLLILGDFRRRTPGPPPFSSMKSTPAIPRPTR
jgi:predicted phage-related endonuclease